MSVLRRTPVNRLGKLMRKSGGLRVDKALAAAEANLVAVQGECFEVMDEKLKQIHAIGAECGDNPTPAQIDRLYGLANDVLEIAGVFGMRQLGEAAHSLCTLVDHSVAGRRWSRAALDVHLYGLLALRATDPTKPEAQALLEGLRQVSDRIGRGEPAQP